MFQCKVIPCPDFSTVPLTAEHKLGLSNCTGEPSALKERRTIVCHPVMDTFLASWSEGRAGERSVLISWHCCHHRQRCYRRAPKNRSQEMPGLQTCLCWVKMAQLDAWSEDVVPPWQDVDGSLLRGWLCLPLVGCLHWTSLFIFLLVEQVWISWWDPQHSQALGSGLDTFRSQRRCLQRGSWKSAVVGDEGNITTLDQQK